MADELYDEPVEPMNNILPVDLKEPEIKIVCQQVVNALILPLFSLPRPTGYVFFEHRSKLRIQCMHRLRHHQRTANY